MERGLARIDPIHLLQDFPPPCDRARHFSVLGSLHQEFVHTHWGQYALGSIESRPHIPTDIVPVVRTPEKGRESQEYSCLVRKVEAQEGNIETSVFRGVLPGERKNGRRGYTCHGGRRDLNGFGPFLMPFLQGPSTGTITTYFSAVPSRLLRMGTHVPPTVGGMSSTLPKYITLYVLLAGIGGGLFLVVVVLYCCKICMGRRLSFQYVFSSWGECKFVRHLYFTVVVRAWKTFASYGGLSLERDLHSRESMKDSEAAGGDQGTNGTSGNLPENIKKTCTVHYSGGGTKILMTVKGGLQRKVSEENQGFPPLSKSPRDVEGFKTCSSSGMGRGEELHYKVSPPHSPLYHNSTVISIEPALSRNLSQSSSSSSLQHDHQSTQNSELPSPRSPRSRHNSGGSSLSRCGSRGSTARENRASMKSIPSRNSSIRRPVGGSLKDSKGYQRRSRGGSTGDSYLTINPDSSPRRSVSLRSPRHTPSRSPQSNFLPLGLYIGSENSVNAARDRADHKKFNPSPTMSTHSVISGQWTPLEAGLEWWTRKHKLELVQHEHPETKINGKIRYNDVGSMEDVRGSDISEYIFADSNEDSETPTMEVQPQQIKHQYRALWELRATLEEEDWATTNNPPKIQRMPGGPSLSPTIPPKEDTQALLASVSYSTEQSPDRDPLSSHTTSFESNTEPIAVDDQRSGSSVHKDVFHHLAPTASASLASRRQSYKNVLHNRMKRLERSASIMQETGNATETTSFDSIETQESTSTDTSRLEAITTSIESTDNTDSTGESHQYQQQLGKFQFRCDSGYKSLENGSSKIPPRFVPRRCLSSGSGADALVPGKQMPLPGTAMRGGSFKRNNDDPSAAPVVFAKVGHLPPPSPGRNVARKRRDFGRFERHSIGSLDSVREPLDEESGSADSSSSRAKGSLFYRYFRNPRSNSAYYTRDYSIDEKSDQLFREFSRCDPAFDMTPFTPRGSTRMYVRRNSSATRGTASLDLGSQRAHSSSSSGAYPPNKPLPRRASHHDSVDDELPLLIPESLRGLPNTRFHSVGGHASIPIITVDDS
ncbi:unnamed protein product [Allacma fusca]|uniref:Uncharacterized protein n=1 Tax=Allacma fusca TaxID=39272 RepID=A0A8J2KDU3_9HEXA|nr:unnamed protein product [Allacma fusca]